MLEELERRNYAPRTIRCYIRVVEQFARHFHRPPDQLGLEHIRQYQAALLRQKKLAPSTGGQPLAALRFFYIQVLKQGWSAAETPYPRQVQHLPQVLSREEVARLIQAARTPFQRAVLMALYATGGRRAEVAALKVSDIDSQPMVVHIHGGKGRKDRDVMLSPRLLDALRAYWRSKRPRVYLFPSSNGHRGIEQPISDKTIWNVCRSAARRAGLEHFMRIRNFGFLANRQRASLLPLCFQLLASSAEISARTASTAADLPRSSSTHRNCPVCGGTMHVVERLSAAQLLLPSPPLTALCAA